LFHARPLVPWIWRRVTRHTYAQLRNWSSDAQLVIMRAELSTVSSTWLASWAQTSDSILGRMSIVEGEAGDEHSSMEELSSDLLGIKFHRVVLMLKIERQSRWRGEHDGSN